MDIVIGHRDVLENHCGKSWGDVAGAARMGVDRLKLTTSEALNEQVKESGVFGYFGYDIPADHFGLRKIQVNVTEQVAGLWLQNW
jgi:hypothetical protein